MFQQVQRECFIVLEALHQRARVDENVERAFRNRAGQSGHGVDPCDHHVAPLAKLIPPRVEKILRSLERRHRRRLAHRGRIAAGVALQFSHRRDQPVGPGGDPDPEAGHRVALGDAGDGADAVGKVRSQRRQRRMRLAGVIKRGVDIV